MDSASLKDLLLAALIRRIEEGETVVTKEGQIVSVECNASVLNTALAFLKQYPPDEGEAYVGELAGTLKKYGDTMKFKTQA